MQGLHSTPIVDRKRRHLRASSSGTISFAETDLAALPDHFAPARRPGADPAPAAFQPLSLHRYLRALHTDVVLMRYASVAALLFLTPVSSGAAPLLIRHSGGGRAMRAIKETESLWNQQYWQRPCQNDCPPSLAWRTRLQQYPHPIHMYTPAMPPPPPMLPLPSLAFSFHAFSRLPSETGEDVFQPQHNSTIQNWTTVQIATPIAVGVAVVALATLAFYWYRRRHRHLYRHTPILQRHRASTVHSAPSGWVRARLGTPRLFFGLLPGTQTVRSRESRKDPSWEIDDVGAGEGWPLAESAGSSASVRALPGAGGAPFRPHLLREDEEGEDEEDTYHARAKHTRNTSSMSLLAGPSPGASSPPPPHLPAPVLALPPPSFLERFVKYKDGLRKSPGYAVGRVRHDAPGARFKIDAGPADPPTPTTAQGPGTRAEPTLVDANTHLLSTSSVKTVDGPVPGSLPLRDADQESVLLISRVPGQDFDIDTEDAHTEVP